MVCRVRGSIRPFIFASRTGAFRRAVPGRRPPPTRSRDRSPRRSLRDVWLGLPLLASGYHIVGRDLSPAMVDQARRALRSSRRRADVGRADMRTLNLGRTFDAVLCLGTAFNYLVEPAEIRTAMRVFRKHLRPGRILILDLTTFD